jgi:hypothetical protein
MAIVRILHLAAFTFASLAVACGGAVDQRGALATQLRSAGDVNQQTDLTALTPTEHRAVLAGHAVTVPMVQEDGERRYMGGVSHLLVNAPADRLFETLSQANVLQRVLPKTKRATLLSGSAQSRTVELVQGNSLVEATYTVTLERRPASSDGSYRVDFRLDRSRPHDVEDLWGSFSLTPVDAGRCVVSLAAFVDLGSSLAVLFEGGIQDLILSTPWHVKRYVDETRLVSATAQ